MFKKLFGRGQKDNKPNIAETILAEIRSRLLPFGFIETKEHLFGPVAVFTRDKMKIYWTVDNRDDMYFLESTNKEDMQLQMGCPQNGNLDEFQGQVVKALDDWLKTI